MSSRRKRLVAQIDASSTADIAFLLLVFFLVTTTMATDIGIQRKLPPPDTGETAEVPKRNVLQISVNGNDELLVNSKLLELPELRTRAAEHILNLENRDDWPRLLDISQPICTEKLAALATAPAGNSAVPRWQKRQRAAAVLGPYQESQQVISIQAAANTSYKAYIAVQDALTGAYADARNHVAQVQLGKQLETLTDAELRAIKTAVPQRISEAEPHREP